jgi:hypothetical protein
MLVASVYVSPLWLAHQPASFEVVALGSFSEIGAGHQGTGMRSFGILNHYIGVLEALLTP